MCFLYFFVPFLCGDLPSSISKSLSEVPLKRLEPTVALPCLYAKCLALVLASDQIITSLDFLFNHLNEGGTYVVEDTFAAYSSQSPNIELAVPVRLQSDEPCHEISTRTSTFSASKFDERVIKKRMKYHKIKYTSLPMFVDLALDVIRCYAFPFKSYGLKQISNFFEYDSKYPKDKL